MLTLLELSSIVGSGAVDTTGLPHPPWRIPFLGDLIGVHPRTPVQDTLRFGRGLGPIFTRKFFSRPIVIVQGADLVGELADEKRFAKHVGLGVRELRQIGGDGLFTAHNDEPNWQRAHDILMPAFTQKSMQGYHPVMVDVARQLTAAWDARAGGPPVDVAADMTKLTLETIGQTGFGYSFGSFDRSEPHPYVSAMVGALRFAQRQVFYLPGISKILGRKAIQRNAVDLATMNALVDDVIAERSKPGAGQAQDLLGLMLSVRHPETGERLDPLNIRYQVHTFLVAGHETTSGALSFALYYLTRHPAALAQAQAEVDRVWGDDPEPDPTFQQVTKLRYVRRVLDESLRLWPTAPAYFREAREDTVIGGRLKMNKGDWVIVPLPLLHRDPTVWGDDPEAFEPDRFAPGRAKERPPHAYKPFGTGERACIGRQFAIHEATLVLGLLLHRYELKPDPGYQLRVTELLTVKPAGFTLEISRRDRSRDTAAAATAESSA
ncbi:cytochrome P450 [Fodinicola feengrottensis]|uniref:cytochrome P450 n=1 Tax=Fodinicola feengrottensis TaxID=435914 RepID=UPI003CD05E00